MKDGAEVISAAVVHVGRPDMVCQTSNGHITPSPC